MTTAVAPIRTRPTDPTDPTRDDAGFTVVEVVVAVILVAAVMASAGIFFVSGIATTAGLQRRDTAAQVADEAMDLVRAVPATAGTSGVATLVENRSRTAVETQWLTAPAALTAATAPAWDDTVTGAPVVPLTVTRSAGGIDYTVDTFIGRCRIPAGDTACTTAADGVEHFRVLVRVAWDEGPGRTCSGAPCEFVLTTLVNGDDEPVFNPDTTVQAPVAVDDTATVVQGESVEIDLLGNDTGSLGDAAVTILTQPTRGSLSAPTPAGRVTYTPGAGVTGTDTFTYRLTGLLGDVSGTATVTVTVTPAAVVDDAAATTFPVPVTVDVRANDTGGFRTGTVSVGPPAGGGTATVSANQVVVTPTVAFPGGVVGAPTGPNLVTNGGFENAPGRATNARTLLATLPGWTRSGGGGAQFEVVHGLDGGAPEGGNYVELDTTANITMSQSVATQPGTRYRLTFRHSPAPGRATATNGLQVGWAGTTVADLAHDATGLGAWWTTYTYEVVATGTSTVLSFTGAGTSDSHGVRIDDVQLHALTPAAPTLSADPWTVAVPYTNTFGTGPTATSGSATVTVTVSPPPAIQTTNRNVCVPRTRNSRVSLSLAAGVTSGTTTNAVYSRTSTPDATVFSTPQGPLLGDPDGTVTVETRGTPPNGSPNYPFTWSVRDAWGRTSSATVTLQVRNSC